MKKILFVLMIFIFMTGCEKCQECEKCSPNIQNKIYSEDELKSVLLQYGKFVYGESDFGQMEDNEYYMSIKDLYENNGYDITQFIKNQCKLDTTKIEVIIEQREPSVIKYNPVLDCKKVQKK